MGSRSKKWVQGLASIWLLWHLFVIFSVPNQTSYLNVTLKPLLLPYANSLGFNRSWQFFSPDPGTPLFLQFEIWKNREKIGSEIYPPLQAPFIRLPYVRRIYLVRILTLFPELAGLVVGPYLCRMHPEASELEMSYMAVKPVTYDEVKEQGFGMNDLSRREFSFIRNEVCRGPGDAR